MNYWQVYYFDNDGQKRIVGHKLTYMQAVNFRKLQRKAYGFDIWEFCALQYEPMN